MPTRRNFGPLDKVALTTRETMREVGLLARERIVRRTRAGQSSDGDAFRPYSTAYAERKAKELGGTKTPNLTASGAMLNDIAILSVTDDEVTLGFTR